MLSRDSFIVSCVQATWEAKMVLTFNITESIARPKRAKKNTIFPSTRFISLNSKQISSKLLLFNEFYNHLLCYSLFAIVCAFMIVKSIFIAVKHPRELIWIFTSTEKLPRPNRLHPLQHWLNASLAFVQASCLVHELISHSKLNWIHCFARSPTKSHSLRHSLVWKLSFNFVAQ